MITQKIHSLVLETKMRVTRYGTLFGVLFLVIQNTIKAPQDCQVN